MLIDKANISTYQQYYLKDLDLKTKFSNKTSKKKKSMCISKRLIAVLLLNSWFLTSCQPLTVTPHILDSQPSESPHGVIQASSHNLFKQPALVKASEDEENELAEEQVGLSPVEVLETSGLPGPLASTSKRLSYYFLDEFRFEEKGDGLEVQVYDRLTKKLILTDVSLGSRLPQLKVARSPLKQVEGLLNQGYYPYKKGNQVYLAAGLVGGMNKSFKPKKSANKAGKCIQTLKGHGRL
ncbi:MAG: hypothetical protein ACK4M7_10885, partial [Burkholderiales bacterium]